MIRALGVCTPLSKAQASALLLLEGTLDGAAKAAKKAARPPKKPPGSSETASKPKGGESGRRSKGRETAAQEPEGPPGKPPKQFPRSHWFKQWEKAIGPLVRLVDKIAAGVREKHDPHHEGIQEKLNAATEEMMEWMGVKK